MSVVFCHITLLPLKTSSILRHHTVLQTPQSEF